LIEKNLNLKNEFGWKEDSSVPIGWSLRFVRELRSLRCVRCLGCKLCLSVVIDTLWTDAPPLRSRHAAIWTINGYMNVF